MTQWEELVRKAGLEPASLSALAPKAVSACTAGYRNHLLQPRSRFPGIPVYPRISQNGYDSVTISLWRPSMSRLAITKSVRSTMLYRSSMLAVL